MGKINLLSFEVANLIAAGEVVDRPASAIKELMENSIDAGATQLTVETKNGGISFMRVSDNGCGMEKDDLPLCIKRHATSKIKNAEDLDGILTLGFRGEALAAISAVSDMRIISRTNNSELGSALYVKAGEPVELTEQGSPVGTTVIAENLFANVPARRKFLKKDMTETASVCANVERVALSHPEISFRLICDNQIRLETAGDGNLKNTIYSVFGKDFASRLIEVNYDYDGIFVNGFIGRSDNTKGNRNYQHFYINNRYVKSKTASAALEQAFVSYLPPDKFPTCVLFLKLNPQRVDVNVHPAKLEVKFSNEKPVFDAIYYSVKQALEENTTRPQVSVGTSSYSSRDAFSKGAGGIPLSHAFAPVEKDEPLKSRQQRIDIFVSKDNTGKADVPKTEHMSAAQFRKEYLGEEKTEEKKTESINIKDKPVVNTATEVIPKAPQKEEKVYVSVSEKQNESIPDASLPDEKEKEQTITPTITEPVNTEEKVHTESNQNIVNDDLEWRMVGEVFNSYIIVEIGEKMLLVDKHAAHERLIFEKLKRNMYSSDVSSQILTFPIDLMLMSDEVHALEAYRDEIEAVGFGFESKKNTVYINMIPSGIEPAAATDMLSTMAERFKNGTGDANITRNIVFEKALYQASCKAAIKAGRIYSDRENEWIVQQLKDIPDITFCPHGRPVAMELTKKTIDRQFERT